MLFIPAIKVNQVFSASAIPDVMRTVQEEELLLLPSYDNLSSSSDEETLGASGYSPEASETLNGDVQRNETYSVVVQFDVESEESADDSDYDAAQCSLAIYQLLEECHINFLVKGEVISGYKVIMHYSNVEHMELCAYYCRMNWDEERCGAVSFLISDKNCTLYKFTSDERAKINLKKNERFIEIIACYDDRSNERLQNASPLRYYFPKTEDVCIVEFYKQRLLSSWQIIDGTTNASSLQECMEKCRDNEVPNGCTAFNFSKKRSCFLFRKESGTSLLCNSHARKGGSSMSLCVCV
ncbi:PAN domain protein, partial [Trichinella nativa]